MKKLGIYLLMFIFVFTVTGCKKRDEGTYKILVKDPYSLLARSLDESYQAGTIVKVEYMRKPNYNCGVIANGKELKTKSYLLTTVKSAKFVMPNHDCVVELYAEKISTDNDSQ